MKHQAWQIRVAIMLLAACAGLLVLNYLIFHNAKDIFFYLLLDVAFVFLEVLLVTLIIHQLLADQEKRLRLEKLSMVIGSFFSTVGMKLLTELSDADVHLDEIKNHLLVDNDWSAQTFAQVRRGLAQRAFKVNIEKVDLDQMRQFLLSKNDFLLRLLENPSLLEHESFTDLLRAVFHLDEELAHRKDLVALPESDRKHIGGDINRVYGHLVREWLDYMKHLKQNYPYLFSLAVRTNPFDEKASVIVTQ